ncbi:FixH family protein [Rurimicrobium arvi]|uniref:Nitrogen fixation protein FixH n=1 Tax=Rurimicrobium arvi TaxID=2049916 RepID=A0ABP8MJM6_9BACT
MNWGYRILIVLLAFLGGIFFMVSIAMRQSNEMMDEQYYKKELVHQQLIDAAANLSRLNGSVQLKDSTGSVYVQLPQSAVADSGSIAFIRPSDKSMDREEALASGAFSHAFSKARLHEGLYLVRVQWYSNGTPYFFEQKYFVSE